MAEDTKERILRTALELFAQNGYLGTSMNDIAGQLGFTKAALYKHYASKQEILDKIVERMNKMDYERAEAYEMPETEPDGFAEAYLHTPIKKIRTYSLWSTWRPSSASWQIQMRTLCSWRWSSMGRCIFYTVSTTVQRKKKRFLLCWRHILITLLPKLSLIAERRNEQHERWRRRKTLGLMSVVRCQDALADTAGDRISNFSSVLSQMQA